MTIQTNKGKFKIETIKDEKGYLTFATNVDDYRYFYTFSVNSLIEDIITYINTIN